MVLGAVATGCGSGDADESTPTGVSGELVLTRQRDLLDRGLINVRTTNGGDESLLLTDLQLRVDGFEIPPARERTTSLRSGRTVAIQVPYGRTVDCDGEDPVGARLDFDYTTEADDGLRRARSL
jgi:hypothetical protein